MFAKRGPPPFFPLLLLLLLFFLLIGLLLEQLKKASKKMQRLGFRKINYHGRQGLCQDRREVERSREAERERSRERAVLRITQTSIHSSSPMRLPCAWAPDQQVRPIATFTSKCQSSCTREREVLARQTGAKATSLPQQQYKQQQTGISTMHALVLRFPPPPSFFFSSSKICNKSCSCFLLPLGLGFLLFEQSHFLPPSLSLSHAHTHTHSLSLSLLAWLN